MKRSHWNLQYSPQARAGGQGFNIEFTPEFARHAKRQTVDSNALEGRLLKILKDVGFSDKAVQFLARSKGENIRLEGGLCWYVNIPGNASGLSLDRHVIAELDHTDRSPEVQYSSHNLDTPNQVCALVAILSRYINALEATLPQAQQSNYKIVWNPILYNGGMGLTIDVTPAFVEFARAQSIEPQHYIRTLSDALTGVRFRDEEVLAHLQQPRALRFDQGLLTLVTVPGNAAGLYLNLDDSEQPSYESSNVDTPQQACALLSVITRYLYHVEMLINSSDKSPKNQL